MTTSCWPESLASSAAQPASRVMNRVVPCRRLSCFSPCCQLLIQHQLGEGAGIVLLRRTGMVGGQFQQRRSSGQSSLPVIGLLLQDVAFDPLPLPDGIVGILDLQARQRIGLDRCRKAAYSVLSSLMNIPIDQPSETMWCMVISSACSSSASRISRPRISGPASRSNGAPASCAVSRSSSSCGVAVLRADRVRAEGNGCLPPVRSAAPVLHRQTRRWCAEPHAGPGSGPAPGAEQR